MTNYVRDEIIDASAYINPRSGIRGHISGGTASGHTQTSIAGKTKPEIEKYLTAIGFQEWLKTADPSQIAVAMDSLEESPRRAATKLSVSRRDRDMLENLVTTFSKPAKPAKRTAAKDSACDLSVVANGAYKARHRSGR